MKNQILLSGVALSVAALCSTVPLVCFMTSGIASDVTLQNNATNVTRTTNYWTPQRLQAAQPLPIPKATSSTVRTTTPVPTGPVESGSGQPPTVNVAPNNQPLFTPTYAGTNQQVQPRSVGTLGAYFTSSQLVPLSADTVYPYSTVGKLFFTIPGQGDFLCSASVIRPRLILTAGHCVHSGSGGNNGFYTNFLFIPAYRDGAAPYQQWTGNNAITTVTWATSGGSVPNAADYAIIQVADQTIGRTVHKIGDLTGYLGYQTNSLFPNQATLLAYSVNLDSGEKMHQVNAGSFRTTIFNTAEYGSDMREGSSGGPWMQNFGVPAVGQTSGSTTEDTVVGVTSYIPPTVGPFYQGSSILDSRFTTLITTACGWQIGNCP